MKQILLEALTAKGRKTLGAHGTFWDIHAHTETVLFNPEKGPWLYVAPRDKGHTSKAAMWIKENNDPNFKIIANEQ